MIPGLAVGCGGREYLLNRLCRCSRLLGDGLEFRMKVRKFRLPISVVPGANNWTWGFHKLIAKIYRFFNFQRENLFRLVVGAGEKSRTRVRLFLLRLLDRKSV